MMNSLAVGALLAGLVVERSPMIGQFRETSAGTARSLVLGRDWVGLKKLHDQVGSFRVGLSNKVGFSSTNDFDILTHLAILSGNATRYGDAMTGTRLCIEYGADPNAFNGLPLWWAARCDKWQKLTERLLIYGAKPNLETHGPGKPYENKPWGTPLSQAIEFKKPKNVVLLLKYGADPNLSSKQKKELPLSAAATTGQVDIVKLLIKAGAKVNAKDSSTGRTALHEAAAKNQAQTVTELLKHKADKRVRDKSGKTALDLARKAKALSAIRALTR
ncbi:MAG: ankyrin repeat domain-containing protein [Fimbriimonadales bacterium]